MASVLSHLVEPAAEGIIPDLIADYRLQHVSKLIPADVVAVETVLCVGTEDGVQQAVISASVLIQFVVVRICEIFDSS